MNSKPLWTPSKSFKQSSRLYAYQQWLAEVYGLHFDSYEQLWQWSVDDIEAFWKSICDYFNVIFHTTYTKILSSYNMPGAKWFKGAKLNYAEHIFRDYKEDQIAIIYGHESGSINQMTWKELKHKVSAMASYLKTLGVTKGDRVVAFLPNVPEATISFLAVNSIGAIWSSTSPDFGVESVVDRFKQIEPKVIIATDGYFYNGKPFDKTNVVKNIVSSLPSLEKVIVLPYLNKTDINQFASDFVNINTIWQDSPSELTFEAVDFNDPMWVLYSSGTTGLPKPIVQSHGGILLEQLKYMALHNDVNEGENFFWFSTTGWMMWNVVQAALLLGSTIVLYDGSPTYPDFNVLWQFSEKVGIHHFGTSAPFLVSSMKKGVAPKKSFDLSTMRSLNSTGAPLPPEAFQYVYDHIKEDVWLCSMAGGTDVCTAFVGGCPNYPVYPGEIQCRALGVSIYAYNDEGLPIEDELGEMIIDKPMPSMPIYFWNDDDNKRYIASYFEDFPGKWRHGDFIKINSKTHGLIIYGRSDATLNRHGIRIGTAEIYRAVDKIVEVEDALIVNLELEEGKHYMPLFVKMKIGQKLSDDIRSKINIQLKTEYSPRHVPDEIIEVPDIPYTISGKKMEAPIKKILLGMSLEKSINFDAMRNPESVDFFIAYAKAIS